MREVRCTTADSQRLAGREHLIRPPIVRLLRLFTLALLLPLSLSCASAPDAPARVGKKPVFTADGLERVDHHERGTLFLKHDHGISASHRYTLSQVLLTYQRDSPHFSEKEEKRMVSYVEDGIAASMRANGNALVAEAGPCVLSIGIGMVDVELYKSRSTGTSTNQLDHWGAVTMVLDIRDSVSGEPLLRYGRRVGIPGGTQFRDQRPQWPKVQSTLDSLLRSQHRTLAEVVPESSEINPTCEAPEIVHETARRTQVAPSD